METYAVEITEELKNLGHSVEIVALPGRADGSAPRALALIGFGLRQGVRLLFRRDAGDVAFGGDLAIWPLLWLACLGSGARPVLSAHGTDISLADRGDLKGRLYSSYLRIGRWLLPPSLLTIANSAATEDRVRRAGYPLTGVVPLGCRVAVDEPTPGFDRKLLFAGRLVTRKGLSWFVREVLPRLPGDIRLAVAGTAWDPTEAEALKDRRVEFLGAVPQDVLHRHMAGAYAVVIPNIRGGSHQFEGFGLVAAEAAAAGGLVLASRIDGYQTSVIDGETGTLIAPGDADSWVDAILALEHLSEDERTARRTLAMQVARREFSWKQAASATVALIEQRAN